MAESTIWWLMAGGAVALELVTGTFYLLMIALAFAAGAVSAHLGLGQAAQIAVAAIVGGFAVFGCYLWRRRRPGDPSVRSLRSLNLDIGETVTVEAWSADRTAQVKYRGAQWTVVLRPGFEPEAGTFRVVELAGNRLLVEKA